MAKGGDIDCLIQAVGCSNARFTVPLALSLSGSALFVTAPPIPLPQARSKQASTPSLPSSLHFRHVESAVLLQTGMRAEIGSRLPPPLSIHAIQGPFLVPAALLYPRIWICSLGRSCKPQGGEIGPVVAKRNIDCLIQDSGFSYARFTFPLSRILSASASPHSHHHITSYPPPLFPAYFFPCQKPSTAAARPDGMG